MWLFLLLFAVLSSISFAFRHSNRPIVRLGRALGISSSIDYEGFSVTYPNPSDEDFVAKQQQEVRIVVIAGFESFNAQLYKNAAANVNALSPSTPVRIFTDIDITENPLEVEKALSTASVVLCSLIFDYKEIQWLRPRILLVPNRFVFESSLELMRETTVGSFRMAGSDGKMSGPPALWLGGCQHYGVREFGMSAIMNGISRSSYSEFKTDPSQNSQGPVKAIIKQFGSQREEDAMSGYLSLLKTGPKLLKWLPEDGIGVLGDIRTWLTVYAYWNEGGVANIVSMLNYMIEALKLEGKGEEGQGSKHTTTTTRKAAPIVESPAIGLFHPGRADYMSSPREFVKWFESHNSWVTPDTPRVGLLLYRKHVVSEQPYLGNLIRLMESERVMPVPVFISGVEAHTVVRDMFTTESEQQALMARGGGGANGWTLSPEAVRVDAIVNTIGFPLVGGPAGSMERGRQIDVAREILTAKNVPYFVAAPLLIQDVKSWTEKGVQGLQQVVLFALPELDGAIETTVLGGLVDGDQILVLPDRVRKLIQRLKAWVNLRKTPVAQRKVGVVVYGFPPNVGAVGTAALLNVGNSLSNLLYQMVNEGMFIGDAAAAAVREDAKISSADKPQKEVVDGGRGADVEVDGSQKETQRQRLRFGEKLTRAMQILSQPQTLAGERDRAQERVQLETGLGPDILEVCFHNVGYLELRQWLGKKMAAKLENQWGPLESYVDNISGGGKAGSLRVTALRMGNVLLGMQPLLGIEGDPMRMLFERDLTPHPQYCAFYYWMQSTISPDCLVHFGMHGTMEWLPGSALGSTSESWPEILIGGMPNVYVYACNNPSESLLAKRRGYATIVSHNVPPYARAGLYKELSSLKELMADWRGEIMQASSSSSSSSAAGTSKATSVLPLIAAAVEKAGLSDDMPYIGPIGLSTLPFATDSGHEMTSDRVLQLLELPDQTVAAGFAAEYSAYLGELSAYLSVLEERLFSEGLYEIGKTPSAGQIEGYLQAVFEGAGDDFLESEKKDKRDEQGGETARDFFAGVLNAVAEGVASGKSKASILLGVWDSKKRRETPDIADFLSVEDCFGLSLLRESGVGAFVTYLSLRVQRAWSECDTTAETKIGELIALSLGSSPSAKGGLLSSVDAAVDLALLIKRNADEEIASLIAAIGGKYVASAPGGDIIRDGIGVLPTGRNIFSLDPYRLPSELAMLRGAEAVRSILKQHQSSDASGHYPETVAVTLWGLDTIKTKGESIAMVLAFVGAIPIRESTGRVVAFAPIPLEELGRPRIDVLCSLSGIFRDSFANVLDLLDGLFESLADADEPLELNMVKKHVCDLKVKGVVRPSSRLFSNPPSEFGSMVNEIVGNGDWSDSSELGDTWENRNSFSYGRYGEAGENRPELLKSLLNTTDRVAQVIDCVEYGLTDIQEYYANTGALKRAAENNRVDGAGLTAAQGGKRSRDVRVSVVEAFQKKVKTQELEETLRLEYRSKLLNPKWAQAMASEGSAGAFEISTRMTAVLGWAGTAGFKEKWVFDGVAERYVLDVEMAERLKASNPEAFRNLISRMLEAKGREFWEPADDTLQRLQDLYSETEDEIEDVRS